MSVPLATLRRHSHLVWLHDSLSAPAMQAAAPSPSPTPPPASATAALPLGATPNAAQAWAATLAAMRAKSPAPAAVAFAPASQLEAIKGTRMAFWSADDAANFLRYWKSDGNALRALRVALQRLEPSAPVLFWSDDEMLDKVAARIARGAIVVTESARPPALSMLPTAPAVPAAVEPPAVPVAQLLAPAPLPKPPLLPLLEEVQIEGAEVLPEIEQSLEQVEITIGEINAAPVSLEPAPTKVPAITTAMTDAGASVTSALDKL